MADPDPIKRSDHLGSSNEGFLEAELSYLDSELSMNKQRPPGGLPQPDYSKVILLVLPADATEPGILNLLRAYWKVIAIRDVGNYSSPSPIPVHLVVLPSDTTHSLQENLLHQIKSLVQNETVPILYQTYEITGPDDPELFLRRVMDLIER